MAILKKSDAESVAKQMTDVLLEEIQIKKDEIAEIVKTDYLATVPNEVKEFFKIHPKWVESGRYIYFEGVGLKYSCANLDNYIPQYNQNTIKISDESAAKVAKLQNDIKDLESKHKRLYKNTLEILLNLKTDKKIREQFPAAIEYLPKDSEPFVPMLPIKDVMAELNTLNGKHGQTASN